MKASFIWYRARSGGELTVRLRELMRSLDTEVISEAATIDPKQISSMLVDSLKSSDITVIIGGTELIREDENIIYILSHCLAVPLEEDENSRSGFVFDIIRGRKLPSFETAVLFPSASGGPEGEVMTSGGKSIIILPWMDRRHMDILAMMQNYLPDMLVPAVSDDESETGSDEKDSNPLPDYIRRAVEKNKPAPASADEELSPAQLKQRLSEKKQLDFPQETNGRARHSGGRTVDISALYKKSGNRSAISGHPFQKRLGNPTPLFRISAVLILLTVIIASCYIGYFYYESGLIEPAGAYQSELAAMLNAPADTSILPQFALDEFAKLYETNSNTRGFISIDGTGFSQPIVQATELSRDAYSGISFYNNADPRGTLYFDQSNDIAYGVTNSNLVIYGNSPTDGSMFAILQNYTDSDFFAKHPVISMDTLYRQGKWLVFSVCIVSGNAVGEFDYANTSLSGDYAKQLHLYNLYIRSMFCTQTQVYPSDELLTLVTDSPEFTGAKLIVCARRMRDGENISDSSGGVIANELVLMPDVWYALHPEAMVPSIPAYEAQETSTVSVTAATRMTDEYGNPIYVSLYTQSTASTTTSSMQTESSTLQTASSTASSDVTSAAGSQPTTLAPASAVPAMRITSGGTVITGSAEEILAMIAEAEMGSDCSLEALKAQCVAAYTYYLYCGGSAKAPSFPTKAAGDRAAQAARAVAGQYLSLSGNVLYTPYFAVSAGKTADNADINGTSLGYLSSVECSVDESSPDFRTVKRLSATETANLVLTRKGIDLSQIDDKTQWFKVLERDENNLYVVRVSVGGTEFKGNTLHLSILGYTCLRSPCFWIEYDASSDEFVFTSQGYGTGVGMSQWGADQYAQQGNNYVWILQHFYPGAVICSK